MSVPIKGSFVGRFALKFVEVLGAGVATAIGSYLVAQLSGYWSSPAQPPAAVQVAPSTPGTPNASLVSKAPRGDADGSKLAPAADAPAPVAAAAPPLRATVTANTQPSRKRNAVEANAEAKPAENKSPDYKPADKEAKTQDKETAESKVRDKGDKDSVEAQVRAALANVDASHQPPQVPPAQPSAGSVAAAPRGADALPPAASPALSPTVPAQPTPLTPVEIKSHPVADVDAAPAPDTEAKTDANTEASPGNDKGLFATLKKIPEFFRTDTHRADEPPRPPKLVGDE